MNNQKNSAPYEPDDPFITAMSELLSLLGHELRTPLAGTMGMLDLVLAGDLAPDQRSALELASVSARTMLRLVEDLHDLARMEVGRLLPESDPFEVGPWWRGIEQAMAGEGKANCVFEIDSAMPEILIGDGERVAHLVLNLADQFLKQSRLDRLNVCFQLVSSLGRHYLLVTLGQEGLRLAEPERAALLQSCGEGSRVPLTAFRQVGLRQAVARNLAVTLGGEIWTAQDFDQRALQALAVPVRMPEEEGAGRAATQVAESLSGMASDAPEVNILLVEDDDAIRRLVELLLKHRGWQVTAVVDGMQALENFKLHYFDLVLMDVRMPRLDGIETTRRIRRREASAGVAPVPIIGMTAHTAMQDRAMCLEAGMDGHLSKPIVSGRLYSLIEDHLAGRK